MLDIGLPLDGKSQHGGTALHWAAFHGDAEMVKLFLTRQPQLETQDPTWGGTPLKWATYGSEHGWDIASGDYPATVQALLRAGAAPPKEPSGGVGCGKCCL